MPHRPGLLSHPAGVGIRKRKRHHPSGNRHGPRRSRQRRLTTLVFHRLPTRPASPPGHRPPPPLRSNPIPRPHRLPPHTLHHRSMLHGDLRRLRSATSPPITHRSHPRMPTRLWQGTLARRRPTPSRTALRTRHLRGPRKQDHSGMENSIHRSPGCTRARCPRYPTRARTLGTPLPPHPRG